MNLRKDIIIKCYNNLILYVAFMCYYLDETKFCLPLDEVMRIN